MLKALAAALVAVSVLSPVAASAKEKTYKTEANATKYCKGDTVVWVTGSGIYHLAGSQHYGKTKDGVYMCKAAAEKEGNREAKRK